MVTPGPGVLSLAGVGAGFGWRVGIMYLIGLFLGTNGVALLVVLGFKQFLFEIDGVELDSYKGDIINDMEFTESSRVPDPQRMIRAYTQSAATLNLLRAFAKGGFSDLNKVHQWNMGFVDESPQGKKFRDLADKISDTLSFMDAIGISSGNTKRLSNFLLWQLAYSEIFFVKKLWPDFNEKDFDKIIKEYQSIKRNFGNI